MDIIEQLKRDEGLRLFPYKDSVGVWTVGYGHNLVAHSGDPFKQITQEQADEWLEEDADTAHANVLKWLPWSKNLSDARFGVLQNMAFNLGARVLGFHNTLKAVQDGRYSDAADGMLDSAWAKQVGARAQRLSTQMRTDQWV